VKKKKSSKRDEQDSAFVEYDEKLRKKKVLPEGVDLQAKGESHRPTPRCEGEEAQNGKEDGVPTLNWGRKV